MKLTSSYNLTSDMNGIKIYEIGDVNMDGKVDVLDLMMLRSANLEKVTLDENQKTYANAMEDYTEEGEEDINVLDLMKIKKYILNQTETAGDRITLDFVDEEFEVEYSMSVVKGTPPESLPELEEGFVWSLSQESYKEVDYTKLTGNTLIYKIKEVYIGE